LFPNLKRKFLKFKTISEKNDFYNNLSSMFLQEDKVDFGDIKNIIIFNIDFNFYKLNFITLVHFIFITSTLKKNKIYFYDMSFKKKYFNVFLKADIQRGFSNLFFFYLLNQYSFRYKPFIFNIELYRNYIYNVLNLPEVDDQFIAKKPKKYGLEETPLKDKFRRLRILEGATRSLLYGYKFHFVGRFTRKQKAASL
jgi:hypothetical protein